MKLLLATIRPTKLDALRVALEKIGISRMSICDALGYARQKGHPELYRGVEYETNLLRKTMVEIAVNDDFLEPALQCIERVARTGSEGSMGDGKVFVLPMDDTIQIEGGQRGPGAI